jgi:mannan endo-1,4-beta-mannosidase
MPTRGPRVIAAPRLELPARRRPRPGSLALLLAGSLALTLAPSAVQGTSPTLSIAPRSAAAGATVKVSGSGFPAGVRIQFTWDSSATGMPRITARATGQLSASFPVPESASLGGHMVSAVSVAARRKSSGSVVSALASASIDVVVASASATPAPLATPTPAPARGAGFVVQCGVALCLDGEPYRFTGLNVYNANSRNNCWYTLGAGSDLDASLAQMGTGNEAIRAWFFQYLATTNGTRDWSAFDHTLAAARGNGKRVVVSLADQWGACERPDASVYKTETWYQSGYRTTPMSASVTVSYRSWVAEVVTRYRDDPTVLAWQLMNEGEDAPAPFTPCSSTAARTLKTWATDMTSVVRAIDSTHLLSIGTSGGGQCGAVWNEYGSLYAIAGVDLCEYHDYGTPGDAMPGDQWNGLAARIDACAALGKPLFVGEVGIRTDEAGGLAGRASAFAGKLDSWFGNGVVGALAWGWRDATHGGSAADDYDIGPGDPTVAIFAAR